MPLWNFCFILPLVTGSGVLWTPIDEHNSSSLSCQNTSMWPAAAAGSMSALDCWLLNPKLYATGTAYRSCSLQGVWSDEDLSNCSTGGWDLLQLDLLTDESVEELGLDKHYHLDSVFTFLLYFPGNKIYGWEWGTLSSTTGCVTNGYYDVPGNMVKPSTRRNVPGQILATNIANCTEWSLRTLISIGNSGKQYINNWATLHRNGDKLNVTTDSSRLHVEVQQLPFQNFFIYRLSITDVHEDMCLDRLRQTCSLTKTTGLICKACASIHLIPLSKSYCTEDSNWADVVNYWCGCAEDCGGPMPAWMNTSKEGDLEFKSTQMI